MKKFLLLSVLFSLLFGTGWAGSKERDQKAFEAYVKASSEKSFLDVLRRYPNAKFPDEKFMESVSEEFKSRRWLEPFMVPGQEMEPSIYFEIAETYFLRDNPKSEFYLNKIINMPDKNIRLFGEDESISMQNDACMYLLYIYRDTKQNKKLCNIADKILNEFPNSGYQVTKWGEGGYTYPEALLAKYKSSTLSQETRLGMLREVLENYAGEGYSAHGGSAESYGNLAIDYLRWANEMKGFEPGKTVSFINGLLINKRTRDKYGFVLNVILADFKLTKAGGKLDPKTKLYAQKHYQEALSFLKGKDGSKVRYGGSFIGNIDIDKIQKGATGDFDWSTNTDDPEAVLPSYNLRPIAPFM